VSDRRSVVADGTARVNRIGVRLLGASQVVMCECGGVDRATGDWVLVERGDKERRLGRVVVAAGRWRGSPVVSTWRVLRAVTPEEMATMVPLIEPAPTLRTWPEIGSTGPARLAPLDRSGMSDLSLGGEDERFRRAKGELPALGQAVRTDQGDGIVLAIDVARRVVTFALTDTGSEIVVRADDLIPPLTGQPA